MKLSCKFKLGYADKPIPKFSPPREILSAAFRSMRPTRLQFGPGHFFITTLK